VWGELVDHPSQAKFAGEQPSCSIHGQAYGCNVAGASFAQARVLHLDCKLATCSVLIRDVNLGQ
jgi:hypothetical protein